MDAHSRRDDDRRAERSNVCLPGYRLCSLFIGFSASTAGSGSEATLDGYWKGAAVTHCAIMSESAPLFQLSPM